MSYYGEFSDASQSSGQGQFHDVQTYSAGDYSQQFTDASPQFTDASPQFTDAAPEFSVPPPAYNTPQFFGDTPQADHGVGSVNLGTNSYSDGTFGAHKDAHPEHHHDKEYHHDGDHHEHHHHDHHDKDHHARISTITSTATKNITQAIRHESSLPAVQEPSQYPSHHEDAARGTLHHEQQSVSSSTCPVCGHSAACVTCAGYIKLDLAISALQAHVITIKNESLEFARKWGSR